MFPYVCLATMPLFCEENWPRKLTSTFWKFENNISPSKYCIYPAEVNKKKTKEEQLPTEVTWKHRIVVILLMSHCGLQTFLPYSHSVTKVSECRNQVYLFKKVTYRVTTIGRKVYMVILGI